MRTLVAYYSRTGNTKFVAEKIAEQLEADLCEVIDKKGRSGKFIILTGGYAAIKEKLTTIEVSKKIEDYDLVIIGSPVWANKMTPAIRTFIVNNDFSEKDVAFFITMDGDDPEKALLNMKEAVNSKSQLGELAITHGLKDKEDAKQRITDFCRNIQKIIDNT
jgi:flavodoxin